MTPLAGDIVFDGERYGRVTATEIDRAWLQIGTSSAYRDISFSSIQRIKRAMPSLTLEQFGGSVGPIIAAMLAHKDIRSTANVSPVVATAVAYNELKAKVEVNASALIAEKLTNECEYFVQLNGPYPAAEFGDDYESALDDVCEKVMEPFEDVLSNDFLGRYTIDSRLHEGEAAVARIAQAFGKCVFESLSWFFPTNDDETGRPMTPAETLSVCGVSQDTIKAALDMRLPVSIKSEKEQQQMDINGVLDRVRKAYATHEPGRRRFLLEDSFETAMDSDDGLAVSAAKTTWGGDMADVQILRSYGKQLGVAAVATLVEMVEAGADGNGEIIEGTAIDMTPPSTPAEDDWMAGFGGGAVVITGQTGVEAVDLGEIGTPAPAPVAEDDWMAALVAPVAAAPTPVPPKRRKSGSQTAATPPMPANLPGGTLSVETLNAIKTATGAKDDDIAALVGLSRPTWNNYLKGKGAFVASAEQRAALIGFIRGKRDALEDVEARL